MTYRNFAVLNASDLSSIKKEDVVGSGDTEWIGDYLKTVADQGDEAHAEFVEEYFRKNFRKLSKDQAVSIVGKLGQIQEPVACLDKFWIWETLEEAIRGEMDTLSNEELGTTMKVFATNYKGSPDLIDMAQIRIYSDVSDLFAK